jgi:hypothetical protein
VQAKELQIAELRNFDAKPRPIEAKSSQKPAFIWPRSEFCGPKKRPPASRTGGLDKAAEKGGTNSLDKGVWAGDTKPNG